MIGWGGSDHTLRLNGNHESIKFKTYGPKIQIRNLNEN